MKTIKNIKHEIIINKSRFICELIYVNTVEEVNKNIEIIKNKYKGATHYCFAYICENQKKASDNGEPSGTAGIPILNILESNNLDNVLCIVIRYFGGIKLGTGGLFRAYSKSVTTTLEQAEIVELIKGIKIYISFDYNSNKKIDNIVKNYIVTKSFDDVISYELELPTDKKDEIVSLLKNNIIELKELNYLYIKKNP